MGQAQPVIMPKFGQTVEECTIVKWLKKAGDTVATGDVLLEIETDKATLEVESFLEGTVLKLLAKEGDTVPVQTTLGFIGQPGDTIPEVKAVPASAPAKKESPAAARPQQSAALPVEVAAPAPVSQSVPVAAAPAGPFRISPRARRLAREKAINPSSITGTGAEGRIVEKDVLAYLTASGYDQLRVTPAALKLAAAEDVDILGITGTGKRITIADIKRAIAEKPKPMSKMRQVIAERLTHSFTTTPHFFVTGIVDMTSLFTLRAGLKKRGSVYSVTDFIIHAVIQSLVEFPTVNSTTDGRSVSWHSRVHLGLAVALEDGLVVPVLRNADGMSLSQIHDGAGDVARKAHGGKLLPDESSGSTFTISNMGMMDVENFTAIINPGESAILAVSSTIKKPVVRNNKVVIRQIMKMTLSSDHRIVDGAVAAQFVNSVKNKLEDTASWKTLTSS